MSRVPLRIRLTAIFAAVMAVVLAGAGYITLTRFRDAQREYGRVIAQHAALADLRRELLTALPIVFIVAAIGAYLLAAAALRPVERLRAQAAAVTEDTPGQRLDVPPSRDEIARLAATLNTMLARLQTAWTANGSLSPTPATSCAPLSACCTPRSNWPCASRATPPRCGPR